jgi:hypothetical protein
MRRGMEKQESERLRREGVCMGERTRGDRKGKKRGLVVGRELHYSSICGSMVIARAVWR